jgi:hypothetical protein
LIVDQMRRLCHDPSVRQPRHRSIPVEIKRHHYPILPFFISCAAKPRTRMPRCTRA